MARVSVVMHVPVGRLEWVSETLRGLEAQTLTPQEVLAVASQEEARRVLGHALKGTPLNVHTIDASGLATPAALNVALESAQSPLIARLDACDAVHPERLERQAAWLLADANRAVAGCGNDWIDAESRAVYRDFAPIGAGPTMWRLPLCDPIVDATAVMRRQHVLEAGGYEESADGGWAHALWLRLAMQGYTLGNLDQALVGRRMGMGRRDARPSTPERGASLASVLREAWASCAHADGRAVERIVARAISGRMSGAEARSALEDLLDEGGLRTDVVLAWQSVSLGEALAGEGGLPGASSGDRRCARTLGQAVRRAGVDAAWLYGSVEAADRLALLVDDLGFGVLGVASPAAPDVRPRAPRSSIGLAVADIETLAAGSPDVPVCDVRWLLPGGPGASGPTSGPTTAAGIVRADVACEPCERVAITTGNARRGD